VPAVGQPAKSCHHDAAQRGALILLFGRSKAMRNLARLAWVLGLLTLAAYSANARPRPASPNDHNSILITFKDGRQLSYFVTDVASVELKAPAMIVFKDGHHQNFPSSEIARIEFKALGTSVLGMNHFVGRWRVGDGVGGHLIITLKRNGQATKSIGDRHGTWTVVNGEARISWDDGWHDIIRKVGKRHEKIAFEPGRSFNDEPSNIGGAQHTTAEPI
jgi:hypothetical protein